MRRSSVAALYAVADHTKAETGLIPMCEATLSCFRLAEVVFVVARRRWHSHMHFRRTERQRDPLLQLQPCWARSGRELHWANLLLLRPRTVRGNFERLPLCQRCSMPGGAFASNLILFKPRRGVKQMPGHEAPC